MMKPLALSLFFFAVLCAGFGHAQPAITTGLVLHDPLNGGVANTLLGGYATHVGGAARTITIPKAGAAATIHGSAGTIAFWVRPRYALDDGALRAFVYADLDTYPEAGKPPVKKEFVVADGWWGAPADTWWNDGSNWLYFIHKSATGATAPHVRTHDINALIERARTTPSSGNQWKFVVVTWAEDTGGHLRFYINGRLPPKEGNMSLASPPALADFSVDGSGNATLYLGNRPAGNRPADAEFDELSVYDRALSAAEVQQLYEGYLPTTWEHHRTRAWMAPESGQTYAPVVDADGTPIENRVLFDENALFLSQGVQAVVATIKDANMNVYVPNIWHGRGARWKLIPPLSGDEVYDSWIKCLVPAICPTAVDAADHYSGSDDPFADLIAEAHANGIEVHPWFTLFLYQWNNPGSTVKHEAWTYAYGGGRAYDPANADYLAYIKARILDVVERYDIDGVNLDYVRYMNAISYSNLPALEARKLAVTAAIADIVDAIRAARPNLVISIDGHVADEFDHRLQHNDDVLGRNQTEWLKDKLIDVAFDMDYDAELVLPKFEHARNYVAPDRTPFSVVKLLGNYESTGGVVSARSPQLLADLVHFSQVRWPGTVAIYWLDEFYRNPLQVSALNLGPFSQPARTLWQFDGPRVRAWLDAPGAPLVANQPIAFSAEALHIEEGELSGSIQWWREAPGQTPVNIGNGATLSHSFSAGSYDVVARCTDSQSRTREAIVPIVVAP